MKPIAKNFIAFLIVAAIIYSCSPQKGDPGPSGNANVIGGILTTTGWLFDSTNSQWSTSCYVTTPVPDTNSAINIYLIKNPGLGEIVISLPYNSYSNNTLYYAQTTLVNTINYPNSALITVFAKQLNTLTTSTSAPKTTYSLSTAFPSNFEFKYVIIPISI